MKTDEFIDDAQRRLHHVMEKFKEMEKDLTPEELMTPPAEGVWGVADIMEHLSVTIEGYGDCLEKGLNRLIEHDLRSDTYSERPTMVARMITNIIKSPKKKAKAPRKFIGKPVSAEQATERFFSSHQRFIDVLENARGLNLTAIKLGTPVSFLIRMRPGDMVTVMTLHAERHLAQAKRVASSVTK